MKERWIIADKSVTPANVQMSVNASFTERTCGETGGLLAGDAVYLDDNDKDSDGVGKAKKADSNANIGTADVDGICQGPAGLNQKVIVVQADPNFNPGFVCKSGEIMVVSSNPAKIAPVTDMTNGWYLSVLGYGNLDGTMNLNAAPTGVPQTTSTTTTTTTTTAS